MSHFQKGSVNKYSLLHTFNVIQTWYFVAWYRLLLYKLPVHMKYTSSDCFLTTVQTHRVFFFSVSAIARREGHKLISQVFPAFLSAMPCLPSLSLLTFAHMHPVLPSTSLHLSYIYPSPPSLSLSPLVHMPSCHIPVLFT